MKLRVYQPRLSRDYRSNNKSYHLLKSGVKAFFLCFWG